MELELQSIFMNSLSCNLLSWVLLELIEALALDPARPGPPKASIFGLPAWQAIDGRNEELPEAGPADA